MTASLVPRTLQRLTSSLHKHTTKKPTAILLQSYRSPLFTNLVWKPAFNLFNVYTQRTLNHKAICCNTAFHRTFFSSRSTFGGDEFEDYWRDDDENAYYKTTHIPAEVEHYMTDPLGDKYNPRARLQKKKMQRLKQLQHKAKLRANLREKAKTPPGPSRRQLRVAELVRVALEDTFAEDLHINTLGAGAADFTEKILGLAQVYVSRVEMSRDLKRAKVYWDAIDPTLKSRAYTKLKQHKTIAKIRGLLAKRIPHLKYSPELEFLPDTSEISEVERSEASGLLKEALSKSKLETSE